jgi:hypothetical protein
MIQIPLGFFYLFLLPPWLHGLPAVAHGLVFNPVSDAGVGVGSGVPDGRYMPLRRSLEFRFGAGSTPMPRRWRWNGFRTPLKHANSSQTAAWDSVAGAQDFAGTTWDFAGGGRISRGAPGISRAEVGILRERFRTTREARGFCGSRADLTGTRQDFAGGPQDFPGTSRDVAGTT